MDRTQLENMIFANATSVSAKNGKLYSASENAVLQALIRLYNRLYGPSNRRLLREDIAREKADCAALRAQHEADARHLGPLAPDLQLHLKNSKE